jgi:hypothetical protein
MEEVEEGGFENHFHSELVAEKEPTTVRCSTCHTGHTIAEDIDPYLTRSTLEAQCNACHRERGEGPSEFRLQAPLAPVARRVF